MALRVQAMGRTGWYFRICEPGPLRAGDLARLVARPHPEWPLTRATRVLYHDTGDRPALAALAALPGLPDSWRRLARRRIETGAVEDWRPRTRTPT